MWMLVLVALLGLALSAAAPVYRTLKLREAERQLLFVGHQFRTAIQRYYEATPGPQKRYPPSLDDLVKDPRFPDARRHLRRIYVDPMTGKAEWGLVMVGGGIAGVHSTSDTQPMKIDDFDPVDAALVGKASYREWQFTHPPLIVVKPETATITPAIEARQADRTELRRTDSSAHEPEKAVPQ